MIIDVVRARSALVCSLLIFAQIGLSQRVRAEAVISPGTSPSVPEDIGKEIRFAVEKYKLANGLTVVLHEDHSAPIITYQTWFKVGSKYEEPSYTGIAHLFEHMMFKGAKRYTGEQFDTVLQANGATNNAFTTQDYTGYYENLPSSKVELVMDIESDRMVNLQITPDNLQSEKQVVKEERRFRVDNSPMGVLREALYTTAFKVHPYSWPVIGYMEDIDHISLEKANEFYHTYYAPNNATLVIAGDFDTSHVKTLINKYYGGISAQIIPNKAIPAEPVQMGARTASVERDVQSTEFSVAYHTPKAGADESYALDLLAQIIGFGPSSRLHQRLVYKDQAALAADASNYTLQDSGLFQIFVSLKPRNTGAKAQKAVFGEIWRTRNVLVTPAELQKAKNQVMKGYVDSLKTVHGKGEALALNETLFSDYERLFTDLDHYNKITAEQIRQAANKYLGAEKSTVVYLRPRKATQGQAHQ